MGGMQEGYRRPVVSKIMATVPSNCIDSSINNSSAGFKTLMTFHRTGWLVGIVRRAYYKPYKNGLFFIPYIKQPGGPSDHCSLDLSETKAITAQCLWSRLTRCPSVTLQRSTNLATRSVPFASFATTTL